jgi:outer membrane lipoprotein carrier protein
MRTAFFIGALSICVAASASEIDRAAQHLTGSRAQFTQRFTPKGFKNSQVESGTVTFGVLPQMRWNYTKPEEKTFIFDGKKTWFYVPADKQVTVSEIDDKKRSELPFLLIGDPEARDRNFIVTEKATGKTVVTTLQPRNPNTAVRNVALTTSNGALQKIEYTDREGNRTSFEFSQQMYLGTLRAGDFEFTPPPGVQVVQAQ